MALDLEQVDKICARQNYFTICEGVFDPTARLIIYAPPNCALRRFEPIDVSGTITTLPDGSAAVVQPTVVGYCDSNGLLLYDCPIAKGADGPTPWPWKVDLSTPNVTVMAMGVTAGGAQRRAMDDDDDPGDPVTSDEPAAVQCSCIDDAVAAYDPASRVLVELPADPLANPEDTQFDLWEFDSEDSLAVYYGGSGSIQSTDMVNNIVATIQSDSAGDSYWLEVDSGPNWQAQDWVGQVQSAPTGSVAWAKTFQDGATLSADLANKVVSRTFPSLGYFYVEEPGRSCGIQVDDPASAAALQIGEVVTIQAGGQMTTVDGERAIEYEQGGDTEWISSGNAPWPAWPKREGVRRRKRKPVYFRTRWRQRAE